MKFKHLLFVFLAGLLGAIAGSYMYVQFFKPASASPTPSVVETVEKDSMPAPRPVLTGAPASAKLMMAPFDFRDIVKKTKDAVVHVRNTQIVVPVYEYYFGYREGQPYKQEGTGSGVIISPDGYIITNYHVIKNASELEVTLNNKKTYPALVIGVDAQNDIAVLKIPANHLPYIRFGDSDALELGEWVLAIGNPFNLGTTVTAGIVSAKARDIKGNNKIDSFIQTDAVINPGNSGGALINEKGELVGINTMIYSMTGSYIGYSFAIPSNIVRKIANDIIQYGSIQQGKLGINGIELNDETAKKLGIDQTEGIYILKVDKNSDAYQKGLRPGDIITEINGQKTSTMAEFLGYLKSLPPGKTLRVKVLKPNGIIRYYDIVLQKNDTIYIGSWGIMVKNLDRAQLRRMGITHGVLITEVRNNELIANGIVPGYVITKINGQPVYTVDDVESLLSNIRGRVIVEMRDPQGRIVRYIFR